MNRLSDEDGRGVVQLEETESMMNDEGAVLLHEPTKSFCSEHVDGERRGLVPDLEA